MEKLRKIFNTRRRSLLSLIVVIACCLLAVVFVRLSLQSPSRNRDRNLVRSFQNGWETIGGARVDMLQFYDIRSTGIDGTIQVYKKLPTSIIDGDCLNIESRFVNFTVLVSGDEIYSYQMEQGFAGSIMDTAYHHIPLTPAMEGRQLEIVAKSNGGTARMRFQNISIGPSAIYVQNMFLQKGLAALIGVLVIMTGFIGLINDVSQKYLKYNYSRTALHMTGILAGFWILFESSLPVLMMPYAADVITVAKYLVLMALPYPAFNFVASILPHKNESWSIALLVLDIISVIASLGLTASGTLEWHECLFFFYIMVLYVVIVVAELTIASFSDAATEHRPVGIDWIIFAGAILCMVSVAFDAIYFISSSTNINDAPTGTWALLTMLVLTIVDTEIEARKHLADTGYLMNEREKAYTDQLTGLLNRTAYERDSDALRDNFSRDTLSGNSYLDSHFDLLIAYFDINNFKHVNDTLGHDVGDKVIQAAANLLQKAFGPYGNVYRVGGDEFAATITGDDLDRKYGKALHNLRMLEDEWNGSTKLGITLKIASGSAKLSTTESGTIHEVLKNADNDMYIHKAEMKKADPTQVRGA